MNDIYNNSLEHLQDELLLVDLLVHAQVIKFRTLRQNSNPMAGLYLNDTEIDELLQQSPGYKEWVDNSASVSEQHETLIKLVSNLNQQMQTRLKNSIEKGIPLKLQEMSRIYSLGSLEMQIFLICLAPEFNSKYNKLYGYLQDDVTKKAPGVELILDLLCPAFFYSPVPTP
ncbi:MAG: hypothetical protein JXR70_16245 [Spirochaetales bacterium]|nr:hypothetical protein [Spirochaetales bacterium]